MAAAAWTDPASGPRPEARLGKRAHGAPRGKPRPPRSARHQSLSTGSSQLPLSWGGPRGPAVPPSPSPRQGRTRTRTHGAPSSQQPHPRPRCLQVQNGGAPRLCPRLGQQEPHSGRIIRPTRNSSVLPREYRMPRGCPVGRVENMDGREESRSKGAPQSVPASEDVPQGPLDTRLPT